MAEKILMNEYKTLSKEPWTNIEVSGFSVGVHTKQRC